jgi:proline iminopeptidase
MFSDLVPLLGDRFTLIRWDQRGCGRSGGLPPYDFATSIADLDAVRARHGFERVTVLGHSWGARLALAYVMTHPARVERLIYVSGTGLDRDYIPAYRERVAARLQGRQGWLWQVSTGFADEATAYARAARLTADGFQVNQEYAAGVATGDEVDGARIRVPVTILHGAADLRPPSVTDSLLAALPDATREVIAGAGHYPWIEQPASFRKLVIAATENAARTA